MSFIIRQLFLVFLLFIVSTFAANAQNVAVSLASGTALRGGATVLRVSITPSGGAQPAAVQWTMNYSTADITGVMAAPGAAAVAASKSVQCSTVTGSVTCIVYGMNSNAIVAGSVADITFQIAPSTTAVASTIQVSRTYASTAAGTNIATTSSGGTVSIAQTTTMAALAGIACSPAAISAPANISCTVSLTGAAPAGGLTVALGSSNSILTLPASGPSPLAP